MVSEIVKVNVSLLPEDFMLDIQNTLFEDYPEYFGEMSYTELESYINENIDNNYTTVELDIEIELPEYEDDDE